MIIIELYMPLEDLPIDNAGHSIHMEMGIDSNDLTLLVECIDNSVKAIKKKKKK